MKSPDFYTKPRAALPGTFSSVKKAVAGTVAGMAFLFAPLAERALAQPAAKGHTEPSIRVSGKKAAIENVSDCVYPSTGSTPAIVTLEGPVEISINVYPILKTWELAEKKSREVEISYMLDGKICSLKGTVSALDEKVDGFEIEKNHSMATLVEIQLAIPEGSHQFSLLNPDALIGVEEKLALVDLKTGRPIYYEPIGVVPANPGEVQKTAPGKVSAASAIKISRAEPPAKSLPEPKPEIRGPEPAPKSEVIAKPVVPAKSRLIDVRGNRFNLVGQKTGDVNEIEIIATPLVSDMLAIAVGSNLSSHGRELELAAFRQTMRSFSANLEAGLGISKNAHNAFLMVFGGVRKTDGMLALPDGRSDPMRLLEAEYGASAGYDYNGMLGICVLGSSNPFSPGRVELYASLPYWYLENDFPTLTADVRWLHLLREKAAEDILGKTSLDVTDIRSRLTLSVPLAKLGPIVPSVIGGMDLSTAEGLRVSGHVGGTLGADILDAVKIEVGAAYGFDGRLLVILNGRLLR